MKWCWHFFSMSKIVVHYFESFWTPLLSISHEKNDFEYVMNIEDFELLLHITSNHKVHHIFQKKISNFTFHSPWEYNMSQNVEIIFISIICIESITHFFCGLWPMSCLDYKVHLSLNINVFDIILSNLKKEKKFVLLIWVHFFKSLNLHMSFI